MVLRSAACGGDYFFRNGFAPFLITPPRAGFSEDKLVLKENELFDRISRPRGQMWPKKWAMAGLLARRRKHNASRPDFLRMSIRKLRSKSFLTSGVSRLSFDWFNWNKRNVEAANDQ